MHYQNKRLAHAREILSGLERRMGLSSVDDIHAFDTGLLRGGEVYCANGSVGQMMRAVSRALSESQWCAVIGIPEVGWLAAVQAGLPSNRAIVIPDVRGHGDAVLHYLIPHVDVVSLGHVFFTRTQQQKIVARARQHRTSIVALEPWVGISRSLPVRERLVVRECMGM